MSCEEKINNQTFCFIKFETNFSWLLRCQLNQNEDLVIHFVLQFCLDPFFSRPQNSKRLKITVSKSLLQGKFDKTTKYHILKNLVWNKKRKALWSGANWYSQEMCGGWFCCNLKVLKLLFSAPEILRTKHCDLVLLSTYILGLHYHSAATARSRRAMLALAPSSNGRCKISLRSAVVCCSCPESSICRYSPWSLCTRRGSL